METIRMWWWLGWAYVARSLYTTAPILLARDIEDLGKVHDKFQPIPPYGHLPYSKEDMIDHIAMELYHGILGKRTSVVLHVHTGIIAAPEIDWLIHHHPKKRKIKTKTLTVIFHSSRIVVKNGVKREEEFVAHNMWHLNDPTTTLRPCWAPGSKFREILQTPFYQIERDGDVMWRSKFEFAGVHGAVDVDFDMSRIYVSDSVDQPTFVICTLLPDTEDKFETSVLSAIRKFLIKSGKSEGDIKCFLE